VITRALGAALVAALLAVGAGAATPQAPKRGGTLILARPPINCLNPFGSCDLITRGVLSQVLEGAYEPGPDFVARPYLVSGVSIGKDRVTLTYHIRSEARWSDGVPVSAADFRFTYRMYSTHESEPGTRELYGRIRRFRALDAKTFVIQLSEPFADWQDLFYEVLPQHALAGEDITAVWRNRVDNPKTGSPIGDGPFLASRLESDRQLTLIRNPAYWGRHAAYLDRIILRWNTLDAADPLRALRQNEIDFLLLSQSPLAGRAPEVRQLPGWRVASWPAFADEHLVFRIGKGGNPALKSKLVRQALAYGIDRVEIARRVNAELGRRAQPLDSTAYLAGEDSYRPNWGVYRYDPARARRLLEQAGCTLGADGIYSCGGERLLLQFVTNAGSAAREQTLQLIEAQLRQAGVDVQPVYVPFPAFFTILRGGNFDAALFSWIRLTGGAAVPEAKCGDEGNLGGYCTRLTMRDVQQIDRVVDPSQRARLLNGLDLKLVRDVPVLPLFQPTAQAALKKTFKGWTPGGTVGNVEQNEDWWLDR
jgi:peptide/nickel transport system substrate-binding protein